MTWNIETIALKGDRKKQARKNLVIGKRFIKGPICLRWVEKAAHLPGKSFHVGLALWYLRGLKKLDTIPLTGATLEIFGVNRHAAYRALKSLEREGLISVARAVGKSPRVTICYASDAKQIEESPAKMVL